MIDEQVYTGSIPQAFRNAIFWRWAPEMPRGLPGAFVTLLYALGTAADAAGRLQFRDGHPIRVRNLAKAMKADEKDVRRYLNAALAAGVILAEGERGRGKAPLYILVISPRPDWSAAVAVLEASKRLRAERKPPPWRPENGGRSPEPPDSGNGGPPPELNGGPPPQPSPPSNDEVRGTAPQWGSGDRPPTGSGDRPPNIPWGTQGVPQEIPDVGDQPQAAREQPTNDQIASREQTPFGRCRECGNPLVTLPSQSPRALCRICEQKDHAKEAS